ncbi:hypothetical protein X942_4738 [Burkholderia pseudomallei MSHR5596]|nr:hypothetical protein X942_4738 [Burkholderia pseudomallei MSHR5596]
MIRRRAVEVRLHSAHELAHTGNRVVAVNVPALAVQEASAYRGSLFCELVTRAAVAVAHNDTHRQSSFVGLAYGCVKIQGADRLVNSSGLGRGCIRRIVGNAAQLVGGVEHRLGEVRDAAGRLERPVPEAEDVAFTEGAKRPVVAKLRIGAEVLHLGTIFSPVPAFDRDVSLLQDVVDDLFAARHKAI